MINARNPNVSSILMKKLQKKPEVEIVVEKNKRRPGWTIYAKDLNGNGMTYCGQAMTEDTLLYRTRLAKQKFGISVD